MKKLWLAVGLLAFLSGLIVIALAANPRGPREPEYQGKKLTRWLDDLRAPSTTTHTDAEFAIRQMGTNAVPFLVQMLEAKDSPFKRKYIELLKGQHYVDFHLHYDYQKHSGALRGLTILGPDAKGAIPALANLLSNSGEEDMAAFALFRIGPPAVPALEIALADPNENVRNDAAGALGALAEPSSVPNLLAALKDPDNLVRSGAAFALRRFPDQANVVVPALMNSLDDPDYQVQMEVAHTLGSFGADAMPAFPKLLKMATDTNQYVSYAATQALKEIDPEAAAKLDGK